jgi:hypothetical protein
MLVFCVKHKHVRPRGGEGTVKAFRTFQSFGSGEIQITIGTFGTIETIGTEVVV